MYIYKSEFISPDDKFVTDYVILKYIIISHLTFRNYICIINDIDLLYSRFNKHIIDDDINEKLL